MTIQRANRLCRAGLISGLLLSATAVHAHYPWLMPSNYSPAEGRSATVYIGWGHSFPLDGFLPNERIGHIEIVEPDGKRAMLQPGDNAGFVVPELKNPGVHVLLASQTSSFFTRTTQGNRQQSKEGLSGVLSCSYSSNNMKAIMTVGDGDGQVGKRFGQVMEIVPLMNPADLKVGDFLDVQVLVRDEPYSGMVYATYAGFSNEGAYAYTVEADNQGKASIRILHPGKWLVRTNVRQPYPDSAVCDIESYTTTLTFAVR
jgi:uncharacterized GH25 family protein